MKKACLILIIIFSNILLIGNTYAARHSICTNDGYIKRWALKRGFTQADCTPTNQAPTVSILSPAPRSEHIETDKITFSASASDAEDGDLSNTVQWYSSIDGQITSSAFLSPGLHTISAIVVDSSGEGARASITISVEDFIPNTPPTISIQSPSQNAELMHGDSVPLTASANDSEDGNISTQVQWFSSINGPIANTTQLSAGQHTLTASVVDSQNESATASVKLTVIEQQANTYPTLNILSPASGSEFELDTPLYFQAQADDAEDGDLSEKVIWHSSRDGTLSLPSTLSVGSHTITAYVTDSGSFMAVDTINITIFEPQQNTAPTIQITAPGNNASFMENEVIAFSAQANDNEDGNLNSNVTWYSSLDGQITSATQLNPGNHIIIASVSDSEGLTSTDSIQLVIEKLPVNTPPTVTILSPSGNSVSDEGATLLFNAQASDAEDGDLSNKVTWHSSLDGSIANITTLSAGDHTITATVTDSEQTVATDQIEISVIKKAVSDDSIQLSWSVPSTRQNGDTLPTSELAGYEITMTDEQEGTKQTIIIEGALVTDYEVKNLQSGTYSFVLQAKDKSGVLSSPSSAIEFVIN